MLTPGADGLPDAQSPDFQLDGELFAFALLLITPIRLKIATSTDWMTCCRTESHKLYGAT